MISERSRWNLSPSISRRSLSASRRRSVNSRLRLTSPWSQPGMTVTGTYSLRACARSAVPRRRTAHTNGQGLLDEFVEPVRDLACHVGVRDAEVLAGEAPATQPWESLYQA